MQDHFLRFARVLLGALRDSDCSGCDIRFAPGVSYRLGQTSNC